MFNTNEIDSFLMTSHSRHFGGVPVTFTMIIVGQQILAFQKPWEAT